MCIELKISFVFSTADINISGFYINFEFFSTILVKIFSLFILPSISERVDFRFDSMDIWGYCLRSYA